MATEELSSWPMSMGTYFDLSAIPTKQTKRHAFAALQGIVICRPATAMQHEQLFGRASGRWGSSLSRVFQEHGIPLDLSLFLLGNLLVLDPTQTKHHPSKAWAWDWYFKGNQKEAIAILSNAPIPFLRTPPICRLIDLNPVSNFPFG